MNWQVFRHFRFYLIVMCLSAISCSRSTMAQPKPCETSSDHLLIVTCQIQKANGELNLGTYEIDLVTKNFNPLPVSTPDTEILTLQVSCNGEIVHTLKGSLIWNTTENPVNTGFVKFISPYSEQMKSAILNQGEADELKLLGTIDLSRATSR